MVVRTDGKRTISNPAPAPTSFEESLFLVAFFGEGSTSRLVRGWDNVKRYLDEQVAPDCDGKAFTFEHWEGHNFDCWGSTEYGDPFSFSQDIGEMSHLQITRVFQE